MTEIPFLGPARLRQLFDRHGLRPHKGWGQHFLIDRSAVGRIVELARVGSGDRVLEIGPGPGTLTGALALAFHSVLAVEVDRGMVKLLGEVLQEWGVADKVTVVSADVLQLDWAQLLGGTGWTLVSNLPYGITAPVLERVFGGGHFGRAIIMLQSDVARRLTASPNTREYGSLSLLAAYHGGVNREFNLGPGSFYPRPRVDSTVVSIDLERPRPFTSIDERLLFDVVRAAFLYRRKQLVNSLATSEALAARGVTRELARVALLELGWQQRRGETLSLADFELLTRALARQLDR